jgi:alpha-ketoglutarate-dependent 2,4-dichlorophenoxyacetate dioxygenase
MSVTIRQIHPVFAGEVSGVDLRNPLTAEEAATIEAGMDRHAVLVFHDQDITDEQQLAFSRNFGKIERAVGGNVTRDEDRRLSFDMADISNLDKDNKVMARDDRRRMFNLGNELWHSDSSYRVIPAKFSLLSARAIPSSGGNTEFADMRAAYDALDDATKSEIEELVTEHSLMHSRGTLGFGPFTPEEQKSFAPVRQRLVRTHPASGRKSLFLASHAGAIVGWPVPEARAFLRDLTEHATQRQFVHAHRWRRYDLVMWDNRATMHRARRYDHTQVRDMRRTTIAGNAPTAEQVRAA